MTYSIQTAREARLYAFIKKFADHTEGCPFVDGYECECGLAVIADEFGIELKRS